MAVTRESSFLRRDMILYLPLQYKNNLSVFSFNRLFHLQYQIRSIFKIFSYESRLVFHRPDFFVLPNLAFGRHEYADSAGGHARLLDPTSLAYHVDMRFPLVHALLFHCDKKHSGTRLYAAAFANVSGIKVPFRMRFHVIL